MNRSIEGKFPSPEDEGLKIVKAAMGFWFIGDIFDCYWTCHSVEYNPRVRKLIETNYSYRLWDTLRIQNLEEYEDDLPPKHGRESCQRKVLELILFERIVAETSTSVRQILDKIENIFGLEENSLFSLQKPGNYLIAD
jgi:hypothetical protein